MRFAVLARVVAAAACVTLVAAATLERRESEDVNIAGIMGAIENLPLPIASFPDIDLPLDGLPINGLPLYGLPLDDLPINGLPLGDLPINGLPLGDALAPLSATDGVSARAVVAPVP